MSMFRRRQAQALRYYLYISDSKLDMLFEQIDRNILTRISAEVKVDLKLASVTLRHAENPGPARTAKLQIVERFIEKHHHIGSIQEPGREYFRGRMDMRWGWLTSDPGLGGRSLVVLFLGWEGPIFVGLAGSRRHVLGEHPSGTDADAPAWSALPNIMVAIGEHISEDPEFGQWIRDTRSAGPAMIGSEWTAAVFDPPASGLRMLSELSLNVPTQPLEFLAVPLVQDQFDRPEIGLTDVPGVLGTPLYVAMAR